MTWPARMVVYGAGGMGARVTAALRRRGVDVMGVLDRGATPGAQRDGMPLQTAQAWLRTSRDACRAVAIAIHNPAHPVGDIVRALRELGYGPIYTPVDLCNMMPEAFEGCFWLAPRASYEGQQANIEALARMLDDDRSRAIVRDVLRMRVDGDYLACPAPDDGQYAPADLPRWPRRLRLLDCGAYTGDTLQSLSARGYELEFAVCLEPDPANYARLVAATASLGIDVLALPCAVGRHAQTMRFSADGAGSSHLSQDGQVVVQAIGVDEALGGCAPNLVKMDIEGAEPDALEGAIATLQRFRPGLAISIYHHPHHLWQIPLWLNERLKNYRFSIRAHSHNSFDLVLYGIAPQMQ